MRHLTRDELLAALDARTDPRVPPVGAAHLETCAACRDELSALGAVVDRVASVEVPEPSPLFWEHFSNRVSRAIREEAPIERQAAPRGLRWGLWRVPATALAGVALILLVVTLAVRHWPEANPSRGGGSVARTAAPAAGPAPAAGAANDESWQTFTALALEVDPEATDLTAAAPNLSEGVLSHLSAEEQGELIRLLKAEMSRGAHRIEG